MKPLSNLLRVAVVATALLAAPSAGAQMTPATPDVITSDNVEYLGGLKQAGDGVGARIVGKYMYVTSTTHLGIFDISNPEAPEQVGAITADVEFENEDVPTNGKILGISASTFGFMCGGPGTLPVEGCLNIYDVSTPAAPSLITSVVGAGEHTHDCILDCTYFYGSEGAIVDARDPAKAKLLENNWVTLATDQGVSFTSSSHDVTEIAPGIIVTATQPILLMSARAEHGATPESPVVLAQGINEDNRFIHSTLWPNLGKDKFLLIGGETVLDGGQCSDESAAFMTWDATKVRDLKGGWNRNTQWALIDEVRMNNGTYQDSYAPVNYFGCSVHWFDEHPTFANGGLVAVSAYEHGTRLFQVTPDGKIVEQGFALPIGGAASAPHWAPDGKVFYTVDYQRGVDVWRYTGDTYVPADDGTLNPTPGATPGTGGQGPDAPPCASASGFRGTGAQGSGGKVRFLVDRREERPFTVEVFQQSQGTKTVKDRRVARFGDKRAGFTWNGKGPGGRRLSDGNYLVRFTMTLGSGEKDVRRAVLTRFKGRFKVAPEFFQPVNCGIFKTLTLSSSVFGGRSKSSLKLAYNLALPVSSVKVSVVVGSKTVRTFTGAGEEGKTVRFTIPSSVARRGKFVKVIVEADRGGSPSAPVTLTAKRI